MMVNSLGRIGRLGGGLAGRVWESGVGYAALQAAGMRQILTWAILLALAADAPAAMSKLCALEPPATEDSVPAEGAESPKDPPAAPEAATAPEAPVTEPPATENEATQPPPTEESAKPTDTPAEGAPAETDPPATTDASIEAAPPALDDQEEPLPAGKALLEAASDLKFRANDVGDLEEVIELLQKAQKAGLEPEDESFAKSLLFACYYQCGEGRTQLIERGAADGSLKQSRFDDLRKSALADLENARQINDVEPEIHYLLARLESMPGGDREAAKKSLNRALELTETPEGKAQALILRAALQSEAEPAMKDLDEAIALFPDNPTAFRARAMLHAKQKRIPEAVADLQKLVELSESDREAQAEGLMALGSLLLETGDEVDANGERKIKPRVNEAIAAFTKLSELIPQNPLPWLQLARAHAAGEDWPAAIQAASKAVELSPENPQLLLMRVEIYFRAREFGNAVKDLEKLVELVPDQADIKLELARALLADDRPRKSIDLLNKLEEELPGNWMLFRVRGDAQLQIAEHGLAIKDYLHALELKVDDSETLNNLAWVLATSPQDEVRNGNAAVLHAIEACELTEYQESHILSTLAAAFAEKGDFNTAIRWSTLAVELGIKEETAEQLKQELQSYRDRKPWRESLNKDEDQPKPERSTPSGE